MIETNTHPSLQPSSEWVRWLQSLALPIWARSLLLIVLAAVLTGGLSMIAWAIIHKDREAMTAAVGLLTVALPVSLIVMSLVFGQRSEKRLHALTIQVLDVLIPEHINNVVCAPLGLQLTPLSRSGCRANYQLAKTGTSTFPLTALKFSVELNVKKVNVMFRLPSDLDLSSTGSHPDKLVAYRHVIAGACAEGYAMNQELARYTEDLGSAALLFYRMLGDDFLLRPIEKLYFAQDLAFFVRGMAEAHAKVTAEPRECL